MSSASTTSNFALFAEKMQQAGLLDAQIERFRLDYVRLANGELGFLPESAIQPAPALPQLEGLQPDSLALDQLVVIKLNGGLGTTMGLEGPKSLLPVRDGLNFLDIVARQMLHWRQSSGARLPLLLMNSYNTSAQSLAALSAYDTLGTPGLPLEFLQSKTPKIEVDTLLPAHFADHPDLEWCPPGHGEIYAALFNSGVLAALRAQGYRYAFISNVDNLGATVDARALNWFVQEKLDFAMEVTRRLPADRKGGHLACDTEGKLLLREVAQCPPADLEAFQDIDKHRFFNTNNLWLNLDSLVTPPTLPLIVNRKKVGATSVYQLESAMGAAIHSFQRTQAIVVDRSRFAPVKNFADLLLVSSDAYSLDVDFELRRVSASSPYLEVEPKTLADFQATFATYPSLRECTRFVMRGPHRFVGEPVILRGEVELDNPGPEPVVLSGP